MRRWVWEKKKSEILPIFFFFCPLNTINQRSLVVIGCLEIPFRGPWAQITNLLPLGRQFNLYPETFREFAKLWGALQRKPCEVETLNFYVLLLYPTEVRKPNLVKFWLRVLRPKVQQFLNFRENGNPLNGNSALSFDRKWRDLGRYSL